MHEGWGGEEDRLRGAKITSCRLECHLVVPESRWPLWLLPAAGRCSAPAGVRPRRARARAPRRPRRAPRPRRRAARAAQRRPPPRSPKARQLSPSCRAAALKLSFLGMQGATGHGELGFAVHNTSGTSCTTFGYPGARFLSPAGALLPTVTHRAPSDFFGRSPVAIIHLAPGGPPRSGSRSRTASVPARDAPAPTGCRSIPPTTRPPFGS